MQGRQVAPPGKRRGGGGGGNSGISHTGCEPIPANRAEHGRRQPKPDRATSVEPCATKRAPAQACHVTSAPDSSKKIVRAESQRSCCRRHPFQGWQDDLCSLARMSLYMPARSLPRRSESPASWVDRPATFETGVDAEASPHVLPSSWPFIPRNEINDFPRRPSRAARIDFQGLSLLLSNVIRRTSGAFALECVRLLLAASAHARQTETAENEKRAGFLRPAFAWQIRHVGLSGATDFLQVPGRFALWIRAIAARVAGAMHCSTQRAGRGSSCEAGSRRLP